MFQRKVFIARHGERLDFVDATWRSAAPLPDDPPLTPRGELQAAQLGLRLQGQGITAVYSSPFQRCTRTASIVAAQCEPDTQSSSTSATPSEVPRLLVKVEPALCERLSVVRYHMTESGPLWRNTDELAEEAGVVDGASRIDGEYRPVFPYSFNHEAYPESVEELNVRCKRVVTEILKRDESGGNILLVGHVSSVKGFISTLSPETGTFALRVPCKLFLSKSFGHFLHPEINA